MGMEEVASEEVVALVDKAVVAILTRLHSECVAVALACCLRLNRTRDTVGLDSQMKYQSDWSRVM